MFCFVGASVQPWPPNLLAPLRLAPEERCNRLLLLALQVLLAVHVARGCHFSAKYALLLSINNLRQVIVAAVVVNNGSLLRDIFLYHDLPFLPRERRALVHDAPCVFLLRDGAFPPRRQLHVRLVCGTARFKR